jgi:hypothetical protein
MKRPWVYYIMTLKSIICVLTILTSNLSYGQKVVIKIKADKQYSNEAGRIRFNVLIKNKSFKDYYVQDTSYIQRNAPTPAFIWPYVEKKVKGKYIRREFGLQGGASLRPDPCSFDCCDCLLLNKGDSLQFSLELLKPYKLEKGEYRVYVLLHPPKAPKSISEKVYTEFKSNYVYFSIN